MTAFLIILHVLVCVFLILFVLLQPGARGGVGAAFGGAGGQTVFGGRGANTFLAKLTAAAAIIFMITCISLSYFVSHTTSVMKTKATATSTDDKKDGDKGDKTKAGGSTSATSAPSGPEDTVPGGAAPGGKPEAPKPAGEPPQAP